MQWEYMTLGISASGLAGGKIDGQARHPGETVELAIPDASIAAGAVHEADRHGMPG